MSTTMVKHDAGAVPGLAGPYKLNALGIRLHDNVIPSLDEWDALGCWLRVVDKSVQWWVGDWVRIGEREYGDLFAQLVDATEWDIETIQQYRWVAENVPYENRRSDLSFSHHREVADLPVDQQTAWLDKAYKGDDNSGRSWTVDRLRRELTATKKDTAVTFWVTVEAKDEDDAEKLANRMRDEGRKVKVR